MKTLLAAIDFSDLSEEVIKQAMSIALASSAVLYLLHVAAPDPDFVGYSAGPQCVRDSRAHELCDELRELHRAADNLRQQGAAVKALLLQGPTVETILDEAEKLDVDAIVIGSHGRGAMYNFLLGSVSEGVIRASHRPVLLVPAPASDKKIAYCSSS